MNNNDLSISCSFICTAQHILKTDHCNKRVIISKLKTDHCNKRVIISKLAEKSLGKHTHAYMKMLHVQKLGASICAY